MKNEKVCISKSVAFIAAVAVLLLGVVLFANYMNSQNLSSNTKAGTNSCTVGTGNWDATSGCEKRALTTDTLADGTESKTRPELTGRKCDSVTSTIVTDYATCRPTVRCSYGEKIYYKTDSTGAETFNQTADVTVGAVTKKCLTDGAATPKNIGIKCSLTVDTISGNAIRGATSSDRDCAEAVTCTGTCEGVNGTEYAIGACAPEGKKQCNCSRGLSYPTWENEASCAAPTPVINCMYGGSNVTDVSTPYHWANVDVGGTIYKCILTSSGANTGFRCKTNATGDITTTGSVSDNTNCTKPAATCVEANFPDYQCALTNGTKLPVGSCTAEDAYGDKWRCGCNSAKSYTYPTLFIDATCP
ncbi:hypothetical protein A2334_03310 [Candidatus Roizmanbacteria bacterium RIFOXYB2_FULL_38_10]|uniref:Uncharacterized protein n=1 Tax=Candidatus Roizmanbacteria bacterium RIFOXYD1_FULL_38_12 TaxID=1802093 RepID=A0A1F7L140_9BACT|nr:MAG: hypothetical protein A3K47_03535 [Candidatus Roizmanbacteria bacterium RIFOXYA2_FULL_38_14]OGK63835.1 MAG: hypothetical protein A3K27_03535 [Candidatus Roizmanbacteria bacterium RIFOXYA1_FULL_37_12]OGK65681.1 MAG: hypothetical protein A3K38_03535 [Candidatus Roizmanbacteria bacterium RIFOXYB1_FULL_40_23]OGK67431.1 MAG: hypothetical protein A2334_03310 [Candidatus Roizmanbacteria bacterium RIFOXYB2_FULL_38_10]OGK70086.1 MAG: hypothetical protein A3K21_03540 [Candidatus Roizmanbacteria ba